MTLLMVSIAGSIAHGQQDPQRPSEQTPQALELTPKAYAQLDWRGYPDWTVAPGSGRLDFNTFDVRRLRAGLDGEWRRVAFEVTVDPQDLVTVSLAYLLSSVRIELRRDAGVLRRLRDACGQGRTRPAT